MFGYKSYIYYLVLVITVECRRYDVETESQKLFGEDLKSILKKFRRSPDYLKILKDKFTDLEDHIDEIIINTIYYYGQELQKRVNEIVGLNETNSNEDDNIGILRSNSFKHRRQPFKLNDSVLREGDDNNYKIHYLDHYHNEQTKIPVQERNAFVDLGFKIVGRIIQFLIESLGSEDDGVISTKSDADNTKHWSSTVHDHVHKGTTKTPTEVSRAERSTVALQRSKLKRRRPVSHTVY